MGLGSEKVSCILGLSVKSLPRAIRECRCHRTEHEIIINGGQCKRSLLT